MQCLQCGNEFEAKRSTAKYCSAKCRKLAFLSVPEQNAKISVPEPVSVPINVTLGNGKLDADIPEVEGDWPDCVPDIIRGAYYRRDDEYRQTINRLLQHSLTELKQMDIFIPVWRYHAGEEAA